MNNDDSGRVCLPPFPPEYRASGVLLHVASPSPYGIGDLGPAAWGCVDRLHEAGQSWWQALPLGPTGCGNSPYQSLSSFAGNELLISPDGLIEDGLLRAQDCESNSFPAAAIDYGAVIPFKRQMPNQIRPFECHLEKEPERDDRAIDARSANMVPRHM